jgi:Asp-tRNA(Asn)/Glu-tRNA(Gln) amidotransferase A subunit family amidase
MAAQQPPYVAVAQRKQAELAAAIPAEWRLPAHLIPAGMLSIAESITEGPKQYSRVNVMEIPRTCGILSPKELEITEKYDVRGLIAAMTEGGLKTEEVVRGFCKVSLTVPSINFSQIGELILRHQRAAIAHQLTRCLTEPLFDRALRRARELDDHLRRSGSPVGPLHGLPVSVKDSFHVEGVDSSIGLSALAFKPARVNADLVDLLQSLGAVVIAKTNVPQTLAALDSCNHLFGRTLNPLNRQWTAGGSTGGEGALIAMRGSMVGFGTDIGGSIRVPAMCQGIYGFKPSNGRVPYGDQESGQLAGKGRIALQPVAGPLARSVADIAAVMAEIVPRAELFGEDCIPGYWPAPSVPGSLAPPRNFTIGILKTDGVVTPLPPITRILDEVAQHLRRTPGVEVVDIPVPPALTKCQSLANRLMGADDGTTMLDLIESQGETLMPWLQSWMKRGKALTIDQLAQLQARRAEIEKEMLKMWTLNASRTRRVDAVVCPIAPHPVPELDRYNATGYTSTFVLLDYPAGTVPVRPFVESDLELGKAMDAPTLGSWDKVNRKLCKCLLSQMLDKPSLTWDDRG